MLDDNFLSYFNTTLHSKPALKTGVLNAPYNQSFELNVGTQSQKINFYGAAAQFEFLEISIMYNKNDQHQTIYDSYNIELVAKTVQSLTIENTSNTYSLTGTLELNIDNANDNYILYQIFVAYNCDIICCTTHSIQKQQDLSGINKINFGNNSHEKLHIDMKRSKGYTDKLEKLTCNNSDISLTVKLKAATTKKLRLKVVVYSQAEYLYTMSDL